MMNKIMDKFDTWLGDSFPKFVILLITVGTLIVGSLIGLVFIVSYPFYRYSCNQQAENLGIDGNYSIWTGCTVEVSPDRYISIDDYRVTINEESE